MWCFGSSISVLYGASWRYTLDEKWIYHYQVDFGFEVKNPLQGMAKVESLAEKWKWLPLFAKLNRDMHGNRDIGGYIDLR